MSSFPDEVPAARCWRPRGEPEASGGARHPEHRRPASPRQPHPRPRGYRTPRAWPGSGWLERQHISAEHWRRSRHHRQPPGTAQQGFHDRGRHPGWRGPLLDPDEDIHLAVGNHILLRGYLKGDYKLVQAYVTDVDENDWTATLRYCGNPDGPAKNFPSGVVSSVYSGGSILLLDGDLMHLARWLMGHDVMKSATSAWPAAEIWYLSYRRASTPTRARSLKRPRCQSGQRPRVAQDVRDPRSALWHGPAVALAVLQYVPPGERGASEGGDAAMGVRDGWWDPSGPRPRPYGSSTRTPATPRRA